MTDNFKLIKDFIKSQWNIPLQWDDQFDSDTDSFYTIEIIGRSKDNAHIIAGNHKFKTYYIRTMEDLDEYENEIKLLCDTLNMRAYISINYKSMKQVTLNTMAEYANRIANNDFNKPQSLFDSCAAKYVERADQLWIVDVDKEDADHYSLGTPITVDELVEDYIKTIESCEPKKKIITVIPTKSGKHIITHPFNIIQFGSRAPHSKSMDAFVKKNGLTLLYENIK
jgi:mRNA-degrading endonuclease HigB of HigAB toxin-antitoxin module